MMARPMCSEGVAALLVGEAVLGRRPVDRRDRRPRRSRRTDADSIRGGATGLASGPAGPGAVSSAACAGPRGSRPAGAGRARSGTRPWPGSHRDVVDVRRLDHRRLLSIAPGPTAGPAAAGRSRSQTTYTLSNAVPTCLAATTRPIL